MKTLKLIAFGIALFLASATQAQISFSVHLGTPPQWGPEGYSGARYYYLPDVEAYYDVQTSRFIYLDGRTWVHRTYLPARYRDYDLYNGYKVVMTDYHGNTPYQYHKQYRVKYARGYRGHEQRNIGRRPEGRNEHQSYRQNNHSNNYPQKVIERKDNRGNGNQNGRGNDDHNDRGNNKKDRK